MKWTDEPRERLRDLAARGFSASEIGSRIGVSRNAVIGAARRNKVPLVCGHPKRVGAAVHRNRSRSARKLTLVPQPPKPKSAPAPTPAPPQPCSLVDLTNESCRWVLTDNAPWVYCGAPEADMYRGTPYCSTHSRLAYSRPGARTYG